MKRKPASEHPLLKPGYRCRREHEFGEHIWVAPRENTMTWRTAACMAALHYGATPHKGIVVAVVESFDRTGNRWVPFLVVDISDEDGIGGCVICGEIEDFDLEER